ncbi:hypothetical protein SACS_1190 [Parasaccharibacter apium]|uniref:Uncharacterized protein n=2 Tax=Parasaccharibacter apium TaxID=1510841 RepID=A0A7U7G6B2_9PROT|nr:hypothetical protein SACS_1190 [Parasaccharibacter apium]
MLHDYRKVAEGNGFDFRTMKPTMITGSDGYNFLEAVIDTYYNNEVRYTKEQFLLDIGLWKNAHYDNIDWHRVTEPTIDDIEAHNIIKSIENRHGKGISIAASKYIYGKLSKTSQNLATHSENYDDLYFKTNDNDNNKNIYYSLEETFDIIDPNLPPPLPPDKPISAYNSQ